MKVYLISNNLVLENIIYKTDESLEQKRINRPLSIPGENLALKVSKAIKVGAIFSSDYASALGTAKYLSMANDLPIYIDSNLRDSKIGVLEKNNIKMLRYMQERDFNFRYPEGESLNETKLRMVRKINDIIKNYPVDLAIITHKRAILSYLLDYTEQGFNLDDRLILSYNDTVVMDDCDKDMDIIELTYDDGKIIGINTLDWEALNESTS